MWLEKFVGQHAELESPTSFWFWSFLSAISAITKDNVWVDRQIYNLYPNIYVMLHAESGMKKGPPISAAKQLVRMVGGTRIISGRSSIQGILKELGTAFTQPGGKPILKSVAFICSSELTSSIVEDKVATDILTDLYDRQYNVGEWRSLLKMESFNLKDPTITMLTATNEAHSTDWFAKKDIHGGYFARTFIIAENKRNKVNSLLTQLNNPPNYAEAGEYLKDIAKLNGPFAPLASRTQDNGFHNEYKVGDEIHYFTDAGIRYQRWYEEFIAATSVDGMKDETGTLNRFGDSVLKVAMLISLAKEPVLEIDDESMELALMHCEKLIGNVRELTHGKKGLSDARLIKSIIIKEIFSRESKSISRTALLRKMWAHYSTADEFDEIMQSFDQAGLIKTNSVGNQIIYSMPEFESGELDHFFSGKNK